MTYLPCPWERSKNWYKSETITGLTCDKKYLCQKGLRHYCNDTSTVADKVVYDSEKYTK